ncbi:endolytic transglycosylase MltG [Diaminobutyricibacter sp. McL0608]|uniref:endolytic transglycosylase MltG n=1 Tax=Leifsonia sp. McL0608 TaxID=3143537 RepID=UPI0031F30D1B
MSHTPPSPGPSGPVAPDDGARDEFDAFDELFRSEPEVAPPTMPAAPEKKPTTRREAREAEARRAQAGENFTPSADAPAPAAAAVSDARHHHESPLAWRQQHYVSHQKPRKKKRSLKPLWITLVILAILGGLAGTAYAIFQPQVAKIIASFEPNDYKGSGSGEVLVSIKTGDTGSDIATTLQKAGVTKTFDAFYSLLLSQHPEPVFQPGAYRLAKQMSAQAALTMLEDPKSRVDQTAVIPEGTAEKDILPLLADATKLPLADLQKAAGDVKSYGVPAEAKTLEGFLFPATYKFTPGTSAHDVIKTLVDRSFTALDDAGVAPADRWKTVVLASIVQREAGLAPDYPKVSRVFLNRLAQGWKLQSDATVAYGTGHTDTVTTTDAERADVSNPYNTYAHAGLPVGPISNPGDLAINAALHPASGTWMYFVTWNLKTGETIFSTTQAEHDAAVQKWQQWMRDNPGYG